LAGTRRLEIFPARDARALYTKPTNTSNGTATVNSRTYFDRLHHSLGFVLYHVTVKYKPSYDFGIGERNNQLRDSGLSVVGWWKAEYTRTNSETRIAEQRSAPE
jgi:hypothetical protein